MPKTTAKRVAPTETPVDRKTVGVPMWSEDLAHLAQFRAAMGKTTRVTPAEGPAALMLYRMGVEVWRAKVAESAQKEART